LTLHSAGFEKCVTVQDQRAIAVNLVEGLPLPWSGKHELAEEVLHMVIISSASANARDLRSAGEVGGWLSRSDPSHLMRAAFGMLRPMTVIRLLPSSSAATIIEDLFSASDRSGV